MSVLLFLLILITFRTIYGFNGSICIEKGQFADIRGPYKHFIFNETLNGNVYYYPRPQATHYLYPSKTSSDYYYVIGSTPYGNQIHSHCLIGNIGLLGDKYLFDVNDCQYWAAYNGTKGAWQIAADMIVTECQFEDICIENGIYLPYINTQYKYMYWNYTVNGAYYFNAIINQWVYPHLTHKGNKTNARYVIHHTVDNSLATAYCIIGIGVPWYYVFSFDDCQIYKSYYRLALQIEPNMTILTNCTSKPTLAPTSAPSILSTQIDDGVINDDFSSIAPISTLNAVQYDDDYQVKDHNLLIIVSISGIVSVLLVIWWIWKQRRKRIEKKQTVNSMETMRAMNQSQPIKEGESNSGNVYDVDDTPYI